MATRSDSAGFHRIAILPYGPDDRMEAERAREPVRNVPRGALQMDYPMTHLRITERLCPLEMACAITRHARACP
ncbi:hypothetical protein A8E81_36260 [Burkholderia cenocepacia]|nr:hypothetical protein A8E74_18280 [Burkholderia cenocepacia]ONV34725.1 hypothetical protein A8E78_09315 [Burkholderia cenocepacia]ONV40420.1 hypothetical protein A8E77_03910 [Burkholderia cenocepacia]ONV42095.1 hypothetical protein A8E81_36260 [Burkholderia cenocepacia]ONV59825.1 hypothetical protein A8E79_19035 [Burkholderia cenocepacia]